MFTLQLTGYLTWMRFSSKLPHGSVFVFLFPEPADIFPGSSAVDSRVCPGSVTVLMSSQLPDRLQSPQKSSKSDVLMLTTSYKQKFPPTSDARRKSNYVTDGCTAKYREIDQRFLFVCFCVKIVALCQSISLKE